MKRSRFDEEQIIAILEKQESAVATTEQFHGRSDRLLDGWITSQK